jgi:CDP-glucose 4,6-dehydratase
LPDCVRALTAGRAIEVRNSGAVRPWQHVLEPLSGYLCLAAALLQGPLPSAESASPDACAWNFGPAAADLVTVATLADTVVRAWGTGSWRRAGEAEEAPHESGTLMLDAGKAQRELGWRPAWDSERAVEAAVRWYKGWARGADAELLVDLCREDIRAYAEAAAQEGASWTAAPPVSPAPGERR